MKRLFVVAFVLSAFFLLGCSSATHTGESKNKKLYTACNIWVHSNMMCINYKMGKFIPAGTEVSHARIVIQRYHQRYKYISFKVVGHKTTIDMRFNSMWHPGKRPKDYKNYFFTEKNFDELVEGMSTTEIDAIKQGKVVVGMSKKAVLVSYGRPAEHRTPDLKSDRWRYWMNKRKQKEICFHNELALSCSDMKKIREKTSDEL